VAGLGLVTGHAGKARCTKGVFARVALGLGYALGAQSRVWLRFSLPGHGPRELNPPPQPGSLRT
jgi:hypothetical protein